MQTFSDIIDLWPTAEVFASDVGINGALARQWRRRNNIPAAHWARVVDAASVRGYPGVTLEMMAAMAAGRGDCEVCANYLPPEEAALPGPSVGEMEEEFGDAATEAALEPRGSAPVFSED
ncbi:MAG: hypothetical protein IH626_05500 [Rhodospirillales bacterium]|nr:hypothetical protein [Rhodospirillales bacterium]